MVGSLGLTVGMWLYNLNPFNMDKTLVMILFIAGGSLLLLAFILFVFYLFYPKDGN